MSIFGDLERLIAGLYPYRWPLTVGLVVFASAAVWVAYARGWHLPLLRHKVATGVAAVVLVAVAIPVGNYLLSPLWERSFLEEASPIVVSDIGPTSVPPVAGATPADATPAPDASFEPRIVRRGTVTGADSFHFGEGTALLIETAPDEYTLRFEDFSVQNGPDLFIYLSPGEGGYEDGAINLGELKATDGAFNYEVPPEIDVADFHSAVVWCRQFSVQFASAPLVSVAAN